MYNGDINKIHQESWDFSHLQDTIVTLLKKYPHEAIYLFGGVEGCDVVDHDGLRRQAQFIHAILIPRNHSPALLIEIRSEGLTLK